MKAIIGKKVGMSQIFDENGHVIPVTVIEAGPCVVTQKKTTEKDGYEAVQLGYEDVAEKKLSKPEVGHLNKAGVSPKKYLREFALDNGSEMELGAVIKADMFQVGDFVDVTGTSKGHGYEGPVKRCGGHRTPMTHGGGPVHGSQRILRGLPCGHLLFVFLLFLRVQVREAQKEHCDNRNADNRFLIHLERSCVFPPGGKMGLFTYSASAPFRRSRVPRGRTTRTAARG